MSGLYTAGARVLPTGAPMVEGRDAIAEFRKVALEGLGVTGATLKTVFAEMAGDSVVEIGEASPALRTGDRHDGEVRCALKTGGWPVALG